MAIENVIYQHNFDHHANDDRIISTLVNGDIEGFSPEHVKIAQFKRNAVLANHWKECPELYGLIGSASFVLEDIDTKKRISYELKTGDRIFIPARVAIKIKAKEGTTIIACSPKLSGNEKTHKYDIKELEYFAEKL
jgi:hypothetical protein